MYEHVVACSFSFVSATYHILSVQVLRRREVAAQPVRVVADEHSVRGSGRISAGAMAHDVDDGATVEVFDDGRLLRIAALVSFLFYLQQRSEAC